MRITTIDHSRLVDELEVPIHVTGFFTPYYDSDLLKTGSLGAGLVLKPGIHCRITFSSNNGIEMNGKEVAIEPVLMVISKLHGVRAEIKTNLKLGVGYALSASSTLGVSLIYSNLAGRSILEAAKEAHRAEVSCLTGLGDVVALFEGEELVFREKPGAPGIGLTESFSIPRNIRIVTSSLGFMKTSHMLKAYADRIKTYGGIAYRRFERDPSFDSFLENSNLFARGVGFLDDRIQEKLRPISTKIIGASVKKRLLFVAVDLDMVQDVGQHLASCFGSAHVFKPSGAEWRKKLSQKLIQGTTH